MAIRFLFDLGIHVTQQVQLTYDAVLDANRGDES